jgi:hypothetical protein
VREVVLFSDRHVWLSRKDRGAFAMLPVKEDDLVVDIGGTKGNVAMRSSANASEREISRLRIGVGVPPFARG